MSDKTTCNIDVAYGDPNSGGLPVSLGVPFRAGELTEVGALSVKGPGGAVRSAGGRVLARHRDGSVRWALVDFGAHEAGRHSLLWNEAAVTPECAVSLQQQEGVWMIDNGRLRLTVCESGPGVIGEITCDGHSYLAAPSDISLNVDDASSLHETKRTVRVLEQSAQRVRLRVEGAHYRADGTRLLNYRLDLEVWAGWPTLRLDYHFFNLEPGSDYQNVDCINLATAWNLGPETQRHFLQSNYDLLYISRHVFNPAPVNLVADMSRLDAHVEDPAMLLDDVDYPEYLHAPLVGTHGWLGVHGGGHAVYIQQQDFTLTRPNRICSSDNRLVAEVWPATAGPLELQQGRSKQQTYTLSFLAHEDVGAGKTKLSAAPTQAPQGVAALLAAPLHEGRAAVDPAWVAYCGDFKSDQLLPVGKHVRLEGYMNSLVRLDMPVTKFDVGDTDSHYKGAYAWIDDRLVRPLPGTPEIPRNFPGSYPTQTYLDLHEPVWTNNEYDVIHAFARELMRTGRTDLWQTLRLAARHNIEVDFLHYSDHKWLHRATPAHSARHTTTGAYASHFWTQGLLEYYCMTGDPDVLEVALALGDKTVANFQDEELRTVSWGFNREIGWSILLLSHLVDLTGEERFKPLLDEMVEYIVTFDRVGFSGGINLSNGNDRQSLNRQIVGNFFGYGSMMEGIDLYADITGRKNVADWLTQLCHDLADEAMNAAREGAMPGIDFSTALAIGYERTGDKRFMDLAELVLDSAYWNGKGPSGDSTVKSVASICRGLTRMLGHCWRDGRLTRFEYPSLRNEPRQ